MPKRSLPRSIDPWQHFTVSLRKTRGRPEVYASVTAGAVTGIVGTRQPMRQPEYQGVVGLVGDDAPLTLDEAAGYAQIALERAFPHLY